MSKQVEDNGQERPYSARDRKKKWIQRNLDAGRCANCGKTRGKDGTTRLCRLCADKRSKNTLKLVQRKLDAGLCESCGQPRGADGTTRRCRQCTDANNERGYRLAERMINAGLCVACSRPRGADGTKRHCRPCADRYTSPQGPRMKRLIDAGLCLRCRQPRGKDGTVRYCRPCADSIAARGRDDYHQMIEEGRCPKHRKPIHWLEKCPACRYEESDLSASSLSFVGLLPPPDSRDKLEACVGCKSCDRTYHKGSRYNVPHFQPALKLRDEHVGEEGRGLWLRFSREDEQEQVEIEYEACSTPDEPCTRLATKKTALDFLRRHRAGELLTGACKEHTQDRAWLAEALTAKLQQQLAQKNGNAEKRKQERETANLLKAVNVIIRHWKEVQDSKTKTYQKKLEWITKVGLARGLGSTAQDDKNLESIANTYLKRLEVHKMFQNTSSWFRCFVEEVVRLTEENFSPETIVTSLKSHLKRAAA